MNEARRCEICKQPLPLDRRARRGTPIEFVTRGLIDEDRAFIFNSYLKGYRENHPLHWAPHALYFGPQAKVLEFLLQSAQTAVACFPEDPGEILGYAIYQHVPAALILHYVYARRRGVGIGGGLVRSIAEDKRLLIATHACDDYRTLRHKAAPMRVTFDPFFVSNAMAHP